MTETKGIHQAINRTRWRMRMQQALDWATVASVLASGLTAAAIYLGRRDPRVRFSIDPFDRAWLFRRSPSRAIAGLVRRYPVRVVATRLDRASNLSDRLATACAFEGRLDVEQDDETKALMAAAIRDAVKQLPSANVKAAAPIKPPKESRAALAFAVVAAALAGLYFPEEKKVEAKVIMTPEAERELELKAKEVLIEEEDEEYIRDLLDEIEQQADATQDPELRNLADEITKLLDDARKGKMTKEQLLARLDRAERKYMDSVDKDDGKQATKDLKKTGNELKKNKETRKLGEALSKGDLKKAQQELKKLAENLENKKLSEKQQKELAKALEKAAEKFEKKDKKRESKLDEQIKRAKKKLEKLQRNKQEEKNPQKKEKLAKREDQQKRELKRLQREQKKDKESKQGRALKQLHRDMKQAAKHMKQRSENLATTAKATQARGAQSP